MKEHSAGVTPPCCTASSTMPGQLWHLRTGLLEVAPRLSNLCNYVAYPWWCVLNALHHGDLGKVHRVSLAPELPELRTEVFQRTLPIRSLCCTSFKDKPQHRWHAVQLLGK